MTALVSVALPVVTNKVLKDSKTRSGDRYIKIEITFTLQ